MNEDKKDEKKYRIVYDRKACIGAAACAAVAPEFWEMKEDGTAHLIGGETDENGNEILIITKSQMTDHMKNALELNKEAAEVCPVQVIHIYDEETGEKLI
jgi:ferredoxin